MDNCIFCQIVAGDIPARKVYEDEQVLAFYDLVPQAPVHVLFIPKTHTSRAHDITPENSAAVARIFETIPRVAEELGITDYRIVNNCGDAAGQSVKHLHFHLLGGRDFTWPPG